MGSLMAEEKLLWVRKLQRREFARRIGFLNDIFHQPSIFTLTSELACMGGVEWFIVEEDEGFNIGAEDSVEV